MSIKRLFDLIFAIFGLILLSPFFLIIALVIKLTSQGPIFFLQERVGRYGSTFNVIKFRTMVDKAQEMGEKITVGHDPRITRIGSFLRKYKLDEFPQLVNVIKGEMSLVGPRPEVPEYVEKYPENIKDIVLSVLPGMTDKASIEFRNESIILAMAEDPAYDYVNKILPIKLDYYVDYVNNRNLLLDLRLIIKTIHVCFSNSESRY